MNILPVILCGGSGSRLWPISNKNYPKQFLNIPNSKISTFQNTLFAAHNINENILLIGNTQNTDIINEQISKININNTKIKIFLEESSRNTFTSTIISALYALENNFEYILILPSDQIINSIELNNIITNNIKHIDKKIIILSTTIENNTEDYGYIKPTNNKIIKNTIFKINDFIEKPSHKILEQIIKHKYYCNTGIFIMNVKSLLNHSNAIMQNEYNKIKNAYQNILNNKILEKYLNEIEKISFDKAIIEKMKDNLYSIYSKKINWIDMGNYNAIYNNSKKILKNLIIDNNNLTKITNVKNSLIINKSDKNLKIYDVSNIIAVITNENSYITTLKTIKYFSWGSREIISQSHDIKIYQDNLIPFQKEKIKINRNINIYIILKYGDIILEYSNKTFRINNLNNTHKIIIDQNINFITIINNSKTSEILITEIENIDIN